METFVSFNKLVMSFNGDSFIEPTSQSMMHRDKWYLMGSGLRTMFSPRGFSMKAEAMVVARGMSVNEPSYLPALDEHGKVDHEAAGSWDMHLEGLVLVLGRDVWYWWATNHPEQLIQVNREILHHYV